MNCKHCGKPVESYSSIKIPSLQWRHASGYYGCNEASPTHSVTYAEPEEVTKVKP